MLSHHKYPHISICTLVQRAHKIHLERLSLDNYIHIQLYIILYINVIRFLHKKML